MSRVQPQLDEKLIRRRPKADDGVERFRRAAGSIRLEGDLPSEHFLEERADGWIGERAGD